MLNDILIAAVAAIVAASFGIGSLLYYLAKEEIDSFKRRFHFRLPKAKIIAVIFAGILGIVQAITTKTSYLETTSLLIFAAGLIFGSFIVAEPSKKITLKYAAVTTAIFLVFFAAVYLILNLKLIS